MIKIQKKTLPKCNVVCLGRSASPSFYLLTSLYLWVFMLTPFGDFCDAFFFSRVSSAIFCWLLSAVCEGRFLILKSYTLFFPVLVYNIMSYMICALFHLPLGYIYIYI